eukprot:SAG22_NODE_296_length_12811_cov_14.899780_18_plen_82_part_00
MDDQLFEALKAKLWKFMEEEVYPSEVRFAEEQREIGHSGSEWTNPPVLEELKAKARHAGLWNLFLPVDSAEVRAFQFSCRV